MNNKLTTRLIAMAFAMMLGSSSMAQQDHLSYGNFVQTAQSAQTTYDYKAHKAYKPSKAATKNDPEAKRKTALSNLFTRKAMEVCGAYDHLPAELFPYQPYYAFKGFYVMADSDATNLREWYDDICLGVMKASLPQFNTASYPIGEYTDLSQGKTIINGISSIPQDELLHSMACSIFAACPTDSEAFALFLKAMALREEIHMYTIIEHPADNDETTSIINRMKRERDLLCTALCAANTPWSIIMERLQHLTSTYKSNKDNRDEEAQLAAFEAALEASTLVKCIAPLHPATKDATFTALSEEVEQMDCASIAQTYASANRDPEQMPKGVKVQAALQTKATQLLKKKFGASFVRCIFTDKSWQLNLDPVTHKKILSRSLPISVVLKEGNKHFIQDWMLQQGCRNGRYTNTYTIEPGLMMDKRPVNL